MPDENKDKTEAVTQQNTENTAADMQSEDAENKRILKYFHHKKNIDMYTVILFSVFLFACFVISLIPSLRPSYSDSEKRELKKFPKFSVASLVSGDYFDGINLWFSDTFPFRDKLMSLNGYISSTFGSNTVQIHGEIEHGDDIPEIASSDTSSDVSIAETPVNNDTGEVQSEATQSSETVPQPDAQDTSEPPPPATEPPAHQPAVEKLSAVLVIDNAAYEYYNFVQSVADSYAATVNRAAEQLAGVAEVYDIIVPTGIAVVAPDDIIAGIDSSDQKKAIDYMYSLMLPSVHKVNAYDTLRKHKNEYLYFRTDHHWTGLGAYYTYTELMKTKGVAPAPLESFEIRQFDGFLGSLYSGSGKKPQLAATPDSVVAYQPRQTNACTVYKRDGSVRNDAPVIMDGNALSQGSKYLSFIGGDNPLTVIENPEISGGACIVIKESYGNAFVPLLTQNYRLVYAVDYRYFNDRDPRHLAQLVADTGADDVIFINNASATRAESLVSAIATFVG